MPLKIGARGFILLGDSFDEPRWREAQVVGLQKEWVQMVVRASTTEVENHSLSSCKVGEYTFCLVESKVTQLRIAAPGDSLDLEVTAKKLGPEGAMHSSWFRRRAQLRHGIRAGCKAGSPESSKRDSTTVGRRDWFIISEQQRNKFRSSGETAKEMARWWYGKRRAVKEVKKKSLSQGQEGQEILPASQKSSVPIGRQGFDSQGDHADGREEFRSHARPACFASGSVSDKEGEEEPKTSAKYQFRELRFLLEQGNLLQQNQFAVLGEAEGPCKGGGALSAVPSQDVQTSTAACQKICQGNRKRAWCRGERLQGDRLHRKNPI